MVKTSDKTKVQKTKKPIENKKSKKTAPKKSKISKASNITETESRKQKGKVLFPSETVSAVIFVNNEYVMFPTLEEAQKASSYMNASEIKYIKTFDNFTKLEDFIFKERKNTSTSEQEDTKIHATPTMQNTNNTSNVSPSPIRNLTSNMTPTLFAIDSTSTSSTPTLFATSTTPVSTLAVPTSLNNQSNYMTRLLEQQVNSQNNQLVIYLFEYKKLKSMVHKPKFKVLAFDFIEKRTGTTVWNHKPNLWEMLFEIDKITGQSQGGQYVNSFYHGFKSCPQRDNPLTNETKQRTTRNNKIVQFWLLYQLATVDMTDDEIKSSVMLLSSMAEDRQIQERYYTLIKNQGFTGELIKQTEPGEGNYWKKLQNAAKHNVVFVKQNTLSSIFKDEEIKIIIEKTFGINMPPHLWPEEIKNFAFQST